MATEHWKLPPGRGTYIYTATTACERQNCAPDETSWKLRQFTGSWRFDTPDKCVGLFGGRSENL